MPRDRMWEGGPVECGSRAGVLCCEESTSVGEWGWSGGSLQRVRAQVLAQRPESQRAAWLKELASVRPEGP